MAAYDRKHLRMRVAGREQLGPGCRVAPHRLPLALVEGTGLRDDLGRDDELAQVVHLRGQLEEPQLSRREPELAAHADADRSHVPGVLPKGLVRGTCVLDGRVDARPVAATREALDRVASADASARAAAGSLAAEPVVQRALARGDASALPDLGYRRGPLAVTVSLPSEPQAAGPAGAIARTVSVVSSGRTIGRVDAVVDLAPALSALGAETRTELALARRGVVDTGPLQAWRVRGPSGRAEQVHVAQQGYRALHEPVSPGVELVAAASDRTITATA